jgi:cyclophilin family peptidyl-prolyl cis-trans isomerase
VTLTLAATSTATDMYAMRLSKDGTTWSDNDWDYYATTYPFVFTPGNGSRQLWVQFADKKWNLSTATISATIDLQVPEIAIPAPHWTPPAPLGKLYYTGGLTTVTLANYASDPAYERVLLKTSKGDIALRLYESQTPLTVANFLRYVQAGRYDDTFFHRLETGFVLQGGGYSIDATNAPLKIEAYAPVKNEFGVANTRGTVAMAKLGNDPDSATCEWFFSLADNTANLDYQNGGFTVFGDVADLAVVDAIAALPCADLGGAFNKLPALKVTSGSVAIPDLIYIQSATRQADALAYTVTGTVPGATATINNGVLTIRPDGTVPDSTVPDSEGTLILRAAAPDGRTADLTLPVQITSNRAPVLEKGAATKKVNVTEDKPLKIKIAVKDPDKGDTLTWSVPTQGTLGIATLVPVTRPSLTGATFLYTPNPNATGTDLFVVCVTDSKGATDTVAVTVTIAPVNDAPVLSCLPTGFTVQAGTTGIVNFTLTDVDSPLDTMKVTIKTGNKKLLPLTAIIAGGTGTARTLTLAPVSSTTGAIVTITLTVTDSARKSATVKIPVTITPAATLPPAPPAPPPAP